MLAIALYCFHSHLSLLVGMVVMCLHVYSYIWATSFCVWIVYVFTLMSFRGLHSFIEMYANGMIRYI